MTGRGIAEKSISQFWPLAASDPQTVNRYYRAVHARFARRTLRGMDHVMSYHTGLAEAAYDLNARWAAPPETFRYVTLRFRGGHSLAFSPDVRNQVTQDHRRFLRDLRSFDVAEDVRLDRLGGQTALVKYVFEYDRPPEVQDAEAVARMESLLCSVTALAQDAFGIRRVVANHVRSEAVAAALDEPGQAPTGELLPSTTRQAFLEIYFDHRDWAEDWFAIPDVRSALLGGGWSRVHGVRVDEECGLDRRCSGRA